MILYLVAIIVVASVIVGIILFGGPGVGAPVQDRRGDRVERRSRERLER